MAAYIHIPQPCSENWNNMNPEEQGRHCLKCAKTVMDFTDWEVESIAAYLKANAEEKLCGRFNASQLTVPIEETKGFFVKQVCYSNLPIFKKIAAIIIIAFGLATTSCDQVIMGKAMDKPYDSIQVNDTTPVLMGEPAYNPEDSIQVNDAASATVGALVYSPEDSTREHTPVYPIGSGEQCTGTIMGDTVMAPVMGKFVVRKIDTVKSK